MNLKNKESFSRSLLISVGGLALLITLTACPKVKVPKGVRSTIPGASGQTNLDVKVHISPTANRNNPVAVDLVLVSDNKLLKELMKMSAKDWFQQKHQVQLDYPKETELQAGSWEWVPGQSVKLDRLTVRHEIVGGIIFANYINEGPHRAVINPRNAILLTLGEDDLCVQLATEITKPCPAPKNSVSNPIPEKDGSKYGASIAQPPAAADNTEQRINQRLDQIQSDVRDMRKSQTEFLQELRRKSQPPQPYANEARGRESYEAIEKSFNNLAGAVPFAEVNAPELDPWAMLKFFKVLGDNEKEAREALDHNQNLGATTEKTKEAKEFLDQLERVREFFAPFLDKEQDPSFDFRVQFRVNREREIAANQIIDWKLEVGKKRFDYTGADPFTQANVQPPTGHWIYGEPVRLTLRWANNSPTRPVTSAAPVPFAVKERSATFEYNDRWSLFTLLLRHALQLKRAGASAECDQGYDADPYTLAFIVGTEPDPAAQPGQPQALNATPAKVFLRITLIEKGKSGPIMIPCFPIKAPPVPALFASGAND